MPVALVCIVVMLTTTSLWAVEGSGTDLAKAAQNQVADMISFPLQNNTEFNFVPDKQTQNVTNFQPVIIGIISIFRAKISL